VDAELEQTILGLSKQVLNVERELIALKASVVALRSYVAKKLNPEDQKAILGMLGQVAQKILDSDPKFRNRTEAIEVIEALEKNLFPKPGESEKSAVDVIGALEKNLLLSPNRWKP
jgi:hypothetical protein